MNSKTSKSSQKDVDALHQEVARLTSALEISKHEKVAANEREHRLEHRREFAQTMEVHIDVGSKWIKVPESLCILLGFTEDEMIGISVLEFIHSNDHPAVLRVQDQLIRGEIESFELEIRFICKNRQSIWMCVNCALIHDTSGIELYLLALFNDTTVKKRASMLELAHQNVLAQIVSGEPLEKILNHLIQSIEEQNEEILGSILLLDESGIHLVHGAAPSLPKEYIEQINGVEIGPLAGSCGAACYFGKSVYVDDIATDPIWEHYKTIALKYGLRASWSQPIFSQHHKVLGSFGMYYRSPRHVTPSEERLLLTASKLAGIAIEKVKTEIALRESEASYRFLVENARDLITRIDLTGSILYVSPSCKTMLGYEVSELQGKCFLELALEEDHLMLKELLQKLFEKIHKSPVTFRVYHKDGRILWLQANPEIVNDPYSKNSIQIIAYSRDVTEHKQLEDQLLQSMKMESIGRLAGGVAHDFNNLLTAILGYTDLAVVHAAQNPELNLFLNNIRTAGKKAASLTSQLLAFARKQIIIPKIVDLNSLILGTDQILNRLIGEHIDFRTVYNHELGLVRVDPGQFQQILMNLVVNSRDAMPEGGTLTIETDNVIIKDKFSRIHADINPGEYVMLSVSDTGLGMSAEIQEHIFEPFFTTKDQGKGTGLGLATCYGIVKQNGGGIELYSAMGIGSTFKIYLPRVYGEIAIESGREIVHTHQPCTETILLVEDDALVRDFALSALRAQGYNVLKAVDGIDALDVSNRYSADIHLLATDVVMPRMGGTELAETLKLSRPEIKVLYISGYTDRAIDDQGLLHEGTMYLQKPYATESLLSKIWNIIHDIPH